ncbi:putative efflux protein, MATE family [Clostridium aceticum]|uniref:Probable multidrug resistance protein NorM n=1 Tax=Clostridium aceticum TaxID=84022 RepID=A0A0D8ICI8_9CLOT|nr:MATE family efflux transporter [Clostridium aceticum]AKL96308.1 putative efflux protein, MATE family [Clostridium aceticum]KJF26906.1 multidrug transporter MatE [Clostridium aceticum]
MKRNNQLTEGSISQALIKLALPIMGTSFVQMAYNMTDMIWIGRVGSSAVAAVGTAGFFTWLAFAFILIPKIGAEVGVAQSTGRKDIKEAKRYIRHTLQLVVFLALLYGSGLILFRKSLIDFFNLGNPQIHEMATSYLVIVSFGMVFYFINPVFTGILNGYGNSRTPFMLNVVGLLTNMFLDPMLILGIGPFPALGVKGAAIATVIAQFIVTCCFVYNIIKVKGELFDKINLLERPDLEHMKSIVRLGIPAALQSGLFTIFAMVLARIIAQWGPVPIAVQKIGSQIEAISWMTASGFSTAISAFVGQNYGAGKWQRIQKGYYVSLQIVGVIGLIATSLLIFAARPIFTIFLPEADAIAYGVVYLRILGLSQLFMCIEIATAGAFNGLGKTVPPSIIGISFNALRIPLALILSSGSLLGLNGVWWSISMTSVLKGVLLTTWFIALLRKESYKSLDKDVQLT